MVFFYIPRYIVYTLNGLGGMDRGKCGNVWATLKHEVFELDVVEMGSRRVLFQLFKII